MHELIPQIPAEYVMPLNMNGLKGRMLRVPAAKQKKREILFVYGHHASLERIYGFAEVLRDYGNVTIPDMPGFGGMDSFYQIGDVPTLDALADYLASFVALRYRNRRVTLIGFSFGFLVITRMLQNYPELRRKVDLVVSMAGFSHHQDFIFTKTRRWMYIQGVKIFERRLPAFFFRSIALHPSVIRNLYKHTFNAKDKFQDLSPQEAKAVAEFEVQLWRSNEIRTHMHTTHEFLTVDNCSVEIPLPAIHVGAATDKYFNNQVVEQHLRVIFDDLQVMHAKSDKHSPSIIADKKAAAAFFPRKLRTILNKS